MGNTLNTENVVQLHFWWLSINVCKIFTTMPDIEYALNKCWLLGAFIHQSELKFKHVLYWFNFLSSRLQEYTLCLEELWNSGNTNQRHSLVRSGLGPVRNVFPEKMTMPKAYDTLGEKDVCVNVADVCVNMCLCVYVCLCMYVCVQVD